MRLDLTDMLYAMSFALDQVEAGLLGINTGHGRHVAYLALLMGEEAGFQKEELRDFVGCCLLHDNALAEYIHEEIAKSPMSERVSIELSQISDLQKTQMEQDHSVIGEQNIHLMPFHTDVKDIILFHHENADGSGPLGKKASDTNLKSQILHLADMADTTRQLTTMTAEEFGELCNWIRSKKGRMFSEESVDLFFKAIDYDKIVYLQEHEVRDLLYTRLHKEVTEYSDEEIRNIADMFANIVDYKSVFTENHSRGVAEKAETMARYYGFDDEKTIRFYFAGAMHDIGKLVVVNDILEKPGKLTANEYEEMKNHAAATRYILSEIKEISDIVEWAANHHEKLNGAGYPRGLTADDLSFEDRLMACIDIYQALTEKRPYKDGMPHEKSIAILTDMAKKGELDEGIVKDLDTVMQERVG